MGATKKSIVHDTIFDEKYDTNYIHVKLDVKTDSDIIDILTDEEYDYLKSLVQFATQSLHVQIIHHLKTYGKYPKKEGRE